MKDRNHDRDHVRTAKQDAEKAINLASHERSKLEVKVVQKEGQLKRQMEITQKLRERVANMTEYEAFEAVQLQLERAHELERTLRDAITNLQVKADDLQDEVDLRTGEIEGLTARPGRGKRAVDNAPKHLTQMRPAEVRVGAGARGSVG